MFQVWIKQSKQEVSHPKLLSQRPKCHIYQWPKNLNYGKAKNQFLKHILNIWKSCKVRVKSCQLRKSATKWNKVNNDTGNRYPFSPLKQKTVQIENIPRNRKTHKVSREADLRTKCKSRPTQWPTDPIYSLLLTYQFTLKRLFSWATGSEMKLELFSNTHLQYFTRFSNLFLPILILLESFGFLSFSGWIKKEFWEEMIIGTFYV